MEFIQKNLTIIQKNFLPKQGNMFKVDQLYTEDSMTFPIGYSKVLFLKLKENKFQYKVEDLRKYNYHLNKPNILNPISFELHDTQKEAFNKISVNNTGIVASATGTGKSILILKTILLRGGNCLIITPTDNIKKQLTELFQSHLNPKIVSNDFVRIDDDFYIKKEEEKLDPTINKTTIQESNNPLDKLSNLFSKDRETKQKNIDPMNKMKNLFTKDTFHANDDNDTPESKFLKKQTYLEPTTKESKKELKKIIKKIEKKNKQITIICWQSLSSVSKNFLKKINTVIIDECHVAGITSIRQSLMAMTNAEFRYFFSATPWKDTNAQFQLLISSIGTNLIYDLGGKEATEKGIISKARFEMLTSPAPKKFLDPKKYAHPSKMRQLKVDGIIANETRNALIVSEAIKLYENNYNIFIAVDEISHLEILQERFKQNNIEIIPIHSELSEKIADENIKKVGQHDGNTSGGLISIGTMKVGLGTDMRNITAVILASGGKSSIRMIQRIGRGARKTTDEFIVIDFFDYFNPKLQKHSTERLKIYKDEYEELRNLDKYFEKYEQD